MQKRYSLKKNAQFKYVYRRGQSSGAREAVLLYVRSNTLKIGFSVGKTLKGGKTPEKVNAVTRNRIKRRMREAIVPMMPRMKQGLYIFIARQPVIEADFDRLQRSMQYLLRKQNLLLPTEEEEQKKAGVSQ